MSYKTELLIIGGQKILCRFRRIRKAKHIRVLIYGDGSLTVTYPFFLSQSYARNFVLERQDRLAKEVMRKNKDRPIDILRWDRDHYLAYKKEARDLIKKKLKYWNKFYGYHYNRLAIRQIRTRWGSCSAKQNLNFNYKLIFLEEDLQDYVIVHELCHLKELNHSSDFWSLVERTIPDYKVRRKKLKSI